MSRMSTEELWKIALDDTHTTIIRAVSLMILNERLNGKISELTSAWRMKIDESGANSQ